MEEFSNSAFMFNELKNYSFEVVVKKYEELEELELLVERLYYLTENNGLLVANLDITTKIENILNYLRKVKYKRDIYSKNMDVKIESYENPNLSADYLNMLNDVVERINNISNKSDIEKDMECYYWCNREYKVRKLPRKISHSFVAPTTSDVIPYIQKDNDIFNMICNDPSLLESIDTIYVLSTINKIISDYPEIIKENETIKNNIMSYLYNPNINASKKDLNKVKDMYQDTLENFVNLVYTNEKKRTLIK